MKTHRRQSLPAAEEASAPETARDPQRAALEAARAEFWEAWQAKQERAERLRQLAQLLGGLAILLEVLVLLITTVIVAGIMLLECFELSQVWVPALGIAGCRAIRLLAGGARGGLNRYADRLEAAEVRYR